MGELKACPRCDVPESADVRLVSALRGHVLCACCGMYGPDNDPSGEKWNALPRYGDSITAELVTAPDPDEAMLMQAAVGMMRNIGPTWRSKDTGKYGANAAMAALDVIRARKQGE